MSDNFNRIFESSMDPWNVNDNAKNMLSSEEMEKRKMEELKSMQAVKYALKNYRVCSYDHVNKCESFLDRLPDRQQKMLYAYRQHLSNVRDCIDKNQYVINEILRATNNLFTTLPDTNGAGIKLNQQEVEKTTRQQFMSSIVDVNFKIFKAQSCLKLIARDWSDAGAEERKQSYQPIIDAIVEFYPPDKFEPNEIKILVPGAGLGRLTYELASRGYECEGNEFSFFMLMISYFILTHCEITNAYTVYPWVHQYVNNLKTSDQNMAIQFPDISPAALKTKGLINIMAGDFLEICNEKNKYDCVATCFFIDCANNIVDFIETIYNILVPGGIWVNLGPLLYHYNDIQGENSIEPSYELLLPIIEMCGFKILRTKTGLHTKYAQNPKSMAKNEYESVFWICQKQNKLKANDDFDDDNIINFHINSNYSA